MFRKFLITSFIFAAIFTAFSPYTAKAANTGKMISYDGKLRLYDGPEISIVLNGSKITCETMDPIIIDDYTYVSARDVFEKLGGVVDWNEYTSEVLIGYGDSLVVLKNGSYTINVNGSITRIPAAPKMVNDRTMIPVRFASQAFGMSVEWRPETNTVLIDDKAVVTPFVDEPANPANATDTSTAIDVDGGLNPEAVELAVDLTQKPISAENHAETVISSLVIPSASENTFTIKAEGKISKVTKFLLNDNRLVIDVYNAEMGTPNTKYEIKDKHYLGMVRIGQNQLVPEKITRFVFDLTSPVGYTVVLTDDRKNILVTFEKNSVTNISFEKGQNYDLINIDGKNAPVVSIFPLSDPDRLVIDLPLGTMSYLFNETVNGNFTSAVRSSQFTEANGRIVADLKELVSYTVSQTGNRTTIKLVKPTFKSLRYDSESKTLIIPKSTGLNVSQISHDDMYLDYKYRILLSGDFSEALGYGEYIVRDYFINSFDIQTNLNTVITINLNKIQNFTVKEDSQNIYITAGNPRDDYERVVVIDPGHGGSDPGTSGNGLIEKELNLDIAKRLYKLLEDDPNIKVYASRLDDVYPSLEDRVILANDVGDLFISIHNNWFDNPKTTGTEVFYYDHANDAAIGITSKRVAEIIQKNLLSALGSTDRGYKSSKYFVLNNTKIPAILCEIGFVSNAEEAANLKNPAYLQKAAEAIYKGILETFDEYQPNK